MAVIPIVCLHCAATYLPGKKAQPGKALSAYPRKTTMKDAVSEETLLKLRHIFGQQLASEIEKWTLKTDDPEATLWPLAVRSHGNLREHIGYMVDVFAKRELDPGEREDAISRIIVAAHERIVIDIKKL